MSNLILIFMDSLSGFFFFGFVMKVLVVVVFLFLILLLETGFL